MEGFEMAYEMNIFRKVRNERDILIAQLQVADAKDYDLVKRKLDAVDELLRYLKSLSYVKHKDTKERMKQYFESDLNCRTTASRVLKSENKKAVNAIEQTVKNQSDKVRRSVDGPLSAIVQAKEVSTIDAAMQNFRESPLQPGTYGYFTPGISRYLPPPQYDPSLSLKDCEKELLWLGVFAHYPEYLFTQLCDQGKIAHILSYINTRSGSTNEREATKQFFDGQFSKSDDGHQQNIQMQVAQMFDWIERQNPYRSSIQEAE
jgi:hypothetical protein